MRDPHSTLRAGTEDVVLKIRINDDGKIDLIGVVKSGIFTEVEFVLAKNIKLEHYTF